MAKRGFRFTLAVSDFRLCARVGFSIPSAFSGQRRMIAAFGYSAPHLSAGGTSTLPINALLSAKYLPADPVDTAVVAAFFEALSPVELDAYERARQAQEKTEKTAAHARGQQLERLRYQARLAERQYRQVDPENRLVAAELERRWEMALRDLEQAERSVQTPTPASRPRLCPELEAAFRAIGQNLPTLWEQTVLSTEQKKALLRCLLDKVVLHREPRDQIQVRMVWRGGEVTTMTVPIAVGSLAELSGAAEMEQLIVEWSQA